MECRGEPALVGALPRERFGSLTRNGHHKSSDKRFRSRLLLYQCVCLNR